MATRFPGYFWNVETQQLYSIKVGGVLRPIKIRKPSHWNKLRCAAYPVCVGGVRRYLDIEYLTKLTYRDSVIGVQQ
jgi:hypothetical protein